MGGINNVLVKETLAEQDESDEELRDKENLNKLIKQVQARNEAHTLNLS